MLALAAFAAVPLGAQDTDTAERAMTVEELERFIEQRKAALERVRENREITADKANEVERALAEQRERQRAAEDELETLCRERDALEPEGYENCMDAGRN